VPPDQQNPDTPIMDMEADAIRPVADAGRENIVVAANVFCWV